MTCSLIQSHLQSFIPCSFSISFMMKRCSVQSAFSCLALLVLPSQGFAFAAPAGKQRPILANNKATSALERRQQHKLSSTTINEPTVFPTKESSKTKDAFYNALSTFESKEASALLEEFQKCRETNTTDAFLLELVSCIPETTPWWARLPLLTRISRRARWESCRRAWNYLTPPPTNAEEETEENLERRKRRAILSLLRTLSQPAEENGFRARGLAIRQIQRQAKRESKDTSSRSKLVAERRPKDLETPTYKVLYNSKNGLEIREYDDYSVCTYDMNGNREYNPKTDAATAEPAKGNVQAFGALAGYLFGKNQEQTAMKMTTPVFSTTTEQKSMSFVLPSNYWDNTTSPPTPLSESGVRIETVSSSVRAVLPFGGYARNVQAQSDELLRQVKATKGWSVEPEASVQLAQYNDPFTPPWKRLNEVSIAVQKDE